MIRLGATFAASLVAFVLASGATADTTTIRVGYVSGATGPHAAGARGFEAELERLAPGRFTVEHFPGGSLGGEREMVEAVQLGSLDMSINGTSVIGNFVPEMMLIDLPFLFEDYEHARAVMDGPVGQELQEKLRSAGLVALGFGEVGIRHLTNSRRPITSVSDLKGLKIRTQENEVHLEAFRMFGALPTPMAWTEVMTALQQGTVDGQENPMSIIVSQKLWETQKHVTLSGHAFTPVAFLLSPTLFDSLSEEDQEIVRAAVAAGRDANRAYVDEEERVGVEALESHGVSIVREIDSAPFREILQPLYDEYEARFPEQIAAIREQAN